MTKPHCLVAAASALLISAAAVTPAAAQLPSLDKQPWLGHFAAIEHKRFRLGITNQGKINLVPTNEKGDPVGQSLAIPILVGIEETLPGGSSTLKTIKPETLVTEDKATDELEKTTIRGKVTGDASFEMIIEQDRGVVSIGGRIVEPGTLTKNPIRFVARFRFPSAYPHNKKITDRKEQKIFDKKIEDDRIDLKWTDGKRVKESFIDPVDAKSKEINGPGIAAAQVEISAYKDRKFVFLASPGSSMTLSNDKPAPLHLGFTIQWSPDPAKDPEGKARVTFEVK